MTVDGLDTLEAALDLQHDVESTVLTLSGMEWLVDPVARVFAAARQLLALRKQEVNDKAIAEALERPLVGWCVEHGVSTPNRPNQHECWLKVIDRKLGEMETPCRIVRARVVLEAAYPFIFEKEK